MRATLVRAVAQGSCLMLGSACSSAAAPPTLPARPATQDSTATAQEVTGNSRIAMGAFGVCALVSSERWACWQLADGQPVVARQWKLAGLTQVQVGRAHACALAGGRVACVGSNSGGQLGIEGIRASESPQIVPGLPPLRQIAVGFDHSCALDTTGSVWCWGRDGAPNTESGNAPRAPHRVRELTARALVAHGHLTCAVTTAGTVHCWGLPEVREPPQAFPTAREFFLSGGLFCAVASGERECTAVLDRQLLSPWASGLLGTARAHQQPAVGESHACELSQSGAMSCWGDNRWAQLGLPPEARLAANADKPVAVELDHPQQLAAHGNVTCALEAAGSVACWGAISPNFRAHYPTPQRVALPEPAQELAARADQSCARAQSGWYCWGRSLAEGAATGVGAAGDGAPPTAHRYGPRLESILPSPTPPASLVVTTDHQQCVLDPGAAVRCGAPGALAPDEPLLSDVRQLVGGRCHVCALTNAGEVYCWGCNHAGQVGSGIPRYSAVPERLPEASHAYGASP